MTGYRIKTVASVTGLSPELLRAWERRHGVVQPRRSRGGYREYSEQDMEKLRLLHQLTTRGYSIGELANLSISDLEEMFERGQEHRKPSPPGQRLSTVADQLAVRITQPDPLGFRRVLRRTLALLPAPEAVETVLLPLLTALSGTQRDDRARSALGLAVEEIRGFVGPLTREVGADAPLVVVVVVSPRLPSLLGLQVQLTCLAAGAQIVGPLTPRDHACLADLDPSAAILCVEAAVETRTLFDLLDHWAAVPLIVTGEAVDVLAHEARRRASFYVIPPTDLPDVLRSVLGSEE